MTSPTSSGGQGGLTLVFSLVILLILTILGLSTLRTSSLEQLMSGNTQESTRALEAADSGIGRALNDFVANSSGADPMTFFKTTIPYTYPPGSTSLGTDSSKATAWVYTPRGPSGTTSEGQIVIPRPSGKPTGKNAGACEVHVDQVVAGTTTNTFAQTTLHNGFYTYGACPKSS